MSSRMPRIAVAAVALGGCAVIHSKPGFEDVQKLVADRTPARISWSTGAEEDRAIDARVTDLLGRPLTADAAVQVALLRNRGLRAVYAQLGVAQADLVQAGLLTNPVLTADVRFGIGVSGTGADIGLVQEFLSILQIPLRKRLAAAAFEATKLEVAAAVLDLATRVKQGFYALQGALQMLELRRTAAEASFVAAEIAGRQHAAGNLTDLDLAGEQVLAEQAHVDVAEAEAAASTQREELTALLGLSGGEAEWTMEGHLPELPASDGDGGALETLALSRRLDLEAAGQQRVVRSRTLALARFYGIVPEASAGVAAQREVEGGGWSLGPAIAIPIPVFDQRQATVASARSQIAQAEDRYAAVAVDVRAEVRRARLRVQAARARADRYRHVVLPLRARIVEETQREYNAMLVGVYQLLQAKRDEVDAGRRWVEALTDYWVGRATLEGALGGDLSIDPAIDPAIERAGDQGNGG